MSRTLLDILYWVWTFGCGALVGWGAAHTRKDRWREEMARLDRKLSELQDKL